MSIQYTTDQLQRKFPDPPASPGFARVAEVMREEGRIEEAMEICREGLRRRPYHLTGYLVLGKCLLDAGNLELAREQFEAALNLDPRCLSAMHNLALIMSGMQWHDAAAGWYRAILALEPWDRKAQDLLEEAGRAAQAAGPRPGATGPAGATGQAAAAGPAAAAPAPSAVPDGVEEFDLNRMADFLPADPASGLEGLDALSQAGPASAGPGDAVAPGTAEPMPMDLLRGDAGTSALGGDTPAPISGQDVEDRLDSLFGIAEPPRRADDRTPEESAANETADMFPASASGGWKAAPDEALVVPDAAPPVPEEISLEEDPLMAESPAPGGAETGLFSPGAFGDAAATSALTEDDFAAAREEAFPAEADRVSGADIEKRLDDLFNLDAEPARGQEPAAVLPEPATAENEPPSILAETEDVVLAPELGTTQFGQTTMFEAPRGLESSSDLVSGQDIADKLDDIFGEEPTPAPKPARAASGGESGAGTAYQGRDRFPEPSPSDVLSTESMIPSSLIREAAGEEGPAPVTGADIEDRLDQLFDIDDAVPAPAPGQAAPAPAPSARQMGPEDDDRTLVMPALKAPREEAPAARPAEPAPARHEDTDGPGDVPGGSDTMILSASEVRSRETGEFPAFGASDTAAVEMVEGSDVVDRLDELFKEDSAPPAPEAPRAAAPAAPAAPPFEDTVRMEDGPLGEASAEESDLILAPMDSPDFSQGAPGETVVSGEDVTSRLSELFEAPPMPELSLPEPEAPEIEVPFFLDEDKPVIEGRAEAPFDPDATLFETKPGSAAPRAGGPARGQEAAAKGPELAPLEDEEEGSYPEEEEMPASAAAGANVATVTLAEIYFQQGLREQALQIYRQLLEREPDNESVRKRIQEIEASKPEGDKGKGGDPLRPRPGLKVPKRKK